ncbi:MAG: hypothetical protein WKF81_08775, partial [Thermomicrobiales bacterium]
MANNDSAQLRQAKDDAVEPKTEAQAVPDSTSTGNTPPLQVPERAPASDELMANIAPPIDTGTFLDRSFTFGRNTAWVIVIAIGLIAAVLFRIAQLDAYALTQREAAWAYNGFTIYVGKSMTGAPDVPAFSPLFMMLESFAFFLFGVTDATARIMPALFGIGLILLTFALRPFVSRYVLLAWILMIGLSPTLVFASRTVSPVIEVCFFALLVVVSILRAGIAGSESRMIVWSGLVAFGIASLIATGVDGVTALLSIAVGIGVGSLTEPRDGSPGAVRRGIVAIGSSTTNGLILAVIILGSLILFFTQFFSDINGVDGVITTFSTWGRMMGTQSSFTPTSIFFWSSLLYEFLAVAFAIVATLVPRRINPDGHSTLFPPLLTGWFVTALVLGSLAQGRDPDQAALIALPLVLLGGMGLGYALERVPWTRIFRTQAGLVPLAIAGITIGVISTLTIIARANDEQRQNDGFASLLIQVAFIFLLLVAPLVYFISREFADKARARYVGWSALIVLAVLLGLFGIRSTSMLAMSRASDGVELLAPRAPTDGVKAM